MEFSCQYTLADYREANAAVRKLIGAKRGRAEMAIVLSITFVALLALLLCAGLTQKTNARGEIIPGFWGSFAVAMMPLLLVIGVIWAVLVPRVSDIQRAIARQSLLLILAGLIIADVLIARAEGATPIPPKASSNQNAWASLLPWFIIFAAVWIAMFRLLRSVPRAGWLAQPHLQLPHRLTLTEAGVTNENPRMRQSYQWDAFICFRDTPTLFVLQISKLSFVMLPKRAIGDAHQIEMVRQMLEQRVPHAEPRSFGFAVVPTPPPRMVESLPPRTMN